MDADLEWSDDELYATPLPGMNVLLPDIDTMHADKKQDTDHRKERNSLSSDEPNELEKQSELERPTESPTRPDRLIDIPTQSDNESSMSDDNIPLRQIQKQLERRSEMPSKTDRLIEIPTQSENESSMSDDNIPLRQIQKHLQNKRKRQVTQLSSESSEFDDSDNDKIYLPSDDRYSSDERCKTPLIEKRKSKWMRKRIRPLKREEGRKQAKKLDSHDKDSKKLGKQYTYSNDCIQKPRTFSKRSKIVQSTSNQTISSQEKQAEESGVELQTALKKSMAVHNANSILKTFAESRLSNLLTCNGLERIHIRPDGNCYFNAVLSQITSTFTPFEFRSELCKHLLDNEEHYKGYMANRATDELETSQHYVEKVNHLKSEGIWNVELSDILPLATANFLNQNITIYTSRLNNPIIHVSPDLTPCESSEYAEIKLSYLAVRGFEHYDACVKGKMNVQKQTSETRETCESFSGSPTSSEQYALPKTPSKASKSTDEVITPRKAAEYLSPKKVHLTRKRTPNTQQWKKTIRKTNRTTGKAYTSAANKREVVSKSVQPSNCKSCKNKCLEKVPEETRLAIFNSYYDKDMTFERKRDFICQHIHVKTTSNRYGRTYKHNSRSFFLPVGTQRVKACKQFFLRTLCIGDKLIRCTLQKKQHGGYSGTDQRGKPAPANKTDIVTIAHVKKHIESFPVVDSHYKRKTTQRKFLEQDLTIRKMHDLCKIKCQEDNIQPVSETVYRNTFCNDYNLSFHRPKKDACQTCNTYEEKKRTGLLTPDDEATHNAHIERKEKSRREKESDKQRSKSNKSVYAATFDLEAVLSTPCSNVSQVYYKRKRNTYNLTFYSLADRKGTCYVWDETHGQRWSSEIGTCVITHINSLPSTVNHVILYSDCCSGQNRNQFLASGLLHTVSKHPYIKVIEQKFLESGHTQMECDSMHAAIEHAKKRTSIFSPDQWDTIFQMARRNNPYTVVPMRFDSFYDLKEYTKTNYKTFKIDTEGIKVNWLKVKVLKVSKETPDQILVKYDFDQTEFRSINVAKASRGRPSPNRDLRRKYKEKIPISMAKKRDLLDLCRSFIIPQQYWKLYELLPTNDKVKDRLTCPDILEEESDTDNE